MKNLDMSLDYMENARFNYLYMPLIKRFLKETKFTYIELISLMMVYHKFVLQNGEHAKFIRKSQLRIICEYLFDIVDPIINSMVVDKASRYELSSDPKFSIDRHCTLPSFLNLFSIFFSNDLEMKMEFTFSIYDTGDRGFLDGEQVGGAVEKFFANNDDDETIELRMDMVEMLFEKFDIDKDSTISFEEYCATVRRQPDLLEFLGQVFPPETTMDVLALCVNMASWFDKDADPV